MFRLLRWGGGELYSSSPRTFQLPARWGDDREEEEESLPICKLGKRFALYLEEMRVNKYICISRCVSRTCYVMCRDGKRWALAFFLEENSAKRKKRRMGRWVLYFCLDFGLGLWHLVFILVSVAVVVFFWSWSLTLGRHFGFGAVVVFFGLGPGLGFGWFQQWSLVKMVIGSKMVKCGAEWGHHLSFADDCDDEDTRGANGDGGDDDGDDDNSKVTPRAVLHSVREEKEPREGRYQVIEQISFFVDFNGK